MRKTILRILLVLGAALLLLAVLVRRSRPVARDGPRVVLISVDGLWPGDLARAESAGVRLAVLDSLARAGVFAAGVIGSLPSVTYPSHTTMITGVPPARHGILSNRRAWEPADTSDSWYWEADRVRVPTVFDLAARAGLRVAAVGWPVTVRDGSVAYNLPEIWDPADGGATALELQRRAGTPWLPDSLGLPARGELGDSLRAAAAAAIIRRWDPDLMALHVIDVDGAKHDHGPVADSVWRALAAADRQVGWVLAALRDRPRPTTVIVTSDHGFLPTRRALRPGVLLVRAGLVRLDAAGKVRDWDAGVRTNGGTAMFIPRDSTAPGIAARIRAAIPDSLVGAGRPIRAVWPSDTVRALGGDPRAAWVIDMHAGFYTEWGYDGALVEPHPGGGHGHDPRRPELHAFFLAAGPAIRAGTRLGVIRQSDVGPTVAKVLGVTMGGVEGLAVF